MARPPRRSPEKRTLTIRHPLTVPHRDTR
ncbi:hypothetical protein GGR01_001668 [Acetobacter oeni]|nr:hypothetical protein [Acetobacter oeni]